jgi:hypothetical protein
MSGWVPLNDILEQQIVDDRSSLTAPVSIPTPPLIADALPIDAGPKGVGGWLLFFCVVLTILSPTSTFVQMVNSWMASEVTFDHFPDLKTAVILEYLWGSSVVVINHDPYMSGLVKAA